MTNPDYTEVLERGRNNRKRYRDYLSRLKRNRKARLDELFLEAHEEAFTLIDCLKCGRCCTDLGPRLKEKDIGRLARRERLSASQFAESRLRLDDDGDAVFTDMPCPYFGSDGYCLVYEDRPGACRDYPHMDSGRQRNRISLHMENLDYCPAVVLALEYLMAEYPG